MFVVLCNSRLGLRIKGISGASHADKVAGLNIGRDGGHGDGRPAQVSSAQEVIRRILLLERAFVNSNEKDDYEIGNDH